MELASREDRIAAAGEYVLGLLSADETREVERALPADAGLRDELIGWERRLALLGLRLPPVTPRPTVWLDIHQRVKSRVTELRPPRTSRAAIAWAGIATAASLVLAVGLVLQQLRGPPPAAVVTKQVAAVSYVALLAVPDSTMKWSVSVTPARQQIVVRAAGEPPDAAKHLDAELWLITAAGPVSLGVIPKAGEVRRPYLGQALESGRTLAVSLEPVGGSPTGKPTGPVVTTATVLQAG